MNLIEALETEEAKVLLRERKEAIRALLEEYKAKSDKIDEIYNDGLEAILNNNST